MAINFGKKDLLNLLRKDGDVKKAIKEIIDEVTVKIFASGKGTDSADDRDTVDWQQKYTELRSEFEKFKDVELPLEKRNAYDQGVEEGKKQGIQEGKKLSDSEWKPKFDSFKKSCAESDNKVKDKVVALQGELAKRFNDAAELYAKYESNEKVKKVLKGYFASKGLEAFVVTLSRESAVEDMWEKCSDCKDDNDTLMVMWQIFMCSMRLVNLTKSKPYQYGSLNPAVGDKFDQDEYVTVGRSKAQGNVSKVILAGYKQGNRIMKQSRVEVQ